MAYEDSGNSGSGRTGGMRRFCSDLRKWLHQAPLTHAQLQGDFWSTSAKGRFYLVLFLPLQFFKNLSASTAPFRARLLVERSDEKFHPIYTTACDKISELWHLRLSRCHIPRDLLSATQEMHLHSRQHPLKSTRKLNSSNCQMQLMFS